MSNAPKRAPANPSSPIGSSATWSPQLRDRLLAVKVADLCDGLHTLRRPVRLADSGLRPVIDFSQLAGPAVTVRTFIGPGKRDYDEQAAELYELGRTCHAPVMAMRCDVPGLTNMGGGGARVIRAHGFSGIILNGPARDSHELRDLGFPLFATGIRPDSIVIDEVPAGSSIHFEMNQPVVIAGQLIRPGDVIVGDHDGVIVIDPQDVEPALAEGEKILGLENEFLPQVENGRSFKDVIRDPKWTEPSLKVDSQ